MCIELPADLHALFLAYNDKFFWGRLISCEVSKKYEPLIRYFFHSFWKSNHSSLIAGQVVASDDCLRGIVQLPGARGPLLHPALRAVAQTAA